MAASMWRMNGLWRGMALALVLFTLLLNNAADATDAPPAETPTNSAADPGVMATSDPQTATTDAGAPADDATTIVPVSGQSNATPAPGDGSLDVSVLTDSTAAPRADSQEGAETSGTSGTTAAPLIVIVTDLPAAAPIAPIAPIAPLRLVVPDVKCVEEKAIDENNAVKATLTTNDCETTKMIIQSNPAPWGNDNCRLDLFQEGNKIRMASPDATPSTLAKVLQSEILKENLGVSAVDMPPSSSGSSVFVAVLLTGLLLAAALIGGYCLKTRRGSDAKGVRLAEEAYPVDEQNQGNTLVSVAPLNPPAETPEKPSVNGESPEADKTQPPPTNGSTTKTADTEL